MSPLQYSGRAVAKSGENEMPTDRQAAAPTPGDSATSSATGSATGSTGRRERNKQLKQARIFTAAAELFAEHGYAAVTTQQIAQRADVATGTLFRYASTKAELLLMVFNDDFRRNLDRGLREVSGTTPGTAETSRLILILLTPLILAGRHSGANTAAYQREILFGEPSERYRAEALMLVAELQYAISDVLARAIPGVRQNSHDADTTLAARAVSNVLHLELARAALDGTPAARVLTIVAAQIDLITRGHLNRPPAGVD